MCGLFGLIRVDGISNAAKDRSTEALLLLGIRSEERGKDASGLALVDTTPHTTTDTSPTRYDAASVVTVIDNSIIIKNATPFSKLPLAPLRDAITEAPVIIGHTRWATQGAADEVINASPLLAGALIGTHNGDVAPTSIPRVKDLKKHTLGETDSELLYLALNRGKGDRRELVKTLRTVKGRAALVFVDRTRPDRVYLARAALSPLSFAYTQDGDFVYASNPDWFRQIEKNTNGRLTFRDITLIPEGNLITVNTHTGELEDIRKFTATCRESDLSLINTAVYRNFTPEDKELDKTLTRHHVAPAPLNRKWPELTPAPILGKPEEVSGDTLELLAGYGEEADLTEFYEDETVDIEELETLCWATGAFDHHTFNSILDQPYEIGLEAMSELREEVKLAYIKGETATGFTLTGPKFVYSFDE